VAALAGAHGERVMRARDLLTAKGRREQQRFLFEGPTLLDEAIRSGIHIEELYVAERIFGTNPTVSALDDQPDRVFIVDDRTMNKLSDVETPTGIIAVAPLRYAPLEALLAGSRTLVLADLNDPGNAGTLLRSAEAFGVGGVVFGNLGVDPYHPKVVRGAMGAIFRLQVAVADPPAFGSAAAAAGATVIGLDARGESLASSDWPGRSAIVVGHERRGLGPWEAFCTRRVAIPMRQASESLNASVAGSIALYVASQHDASQEGAADAAPGLT